MGEIDTFPKWIKAVGFILAGIVAVPALLCIWFVYMFFWLVGYWSNELMVWLKTV